MQIKEPRLNSAGHRTTDEDDRPPSSSSQKRNLKEVLRQVDEDPHIPSNLDSPIVLDNDSPEKPTKKVKRSPGMTTKLPPFKPLKIAKPTNSATLPEAQRSPAKTMQHSSPQQLADQLRQARGSPAQRTRAKTASPAKREARSTSVSTEYLSGIHSYAEGARDADAEKEETARVVMDATSSSEDSDSELDGEVLETQEIDIDIEERIARESPQLQKDGKTCGSADGSQGFEALV